MSQTVRGLILGSPGLLGSKPICDLYGVGSPVVSTDPAVIGAGTGSTYRDYIGGTLWFLGLLGWKQVTVT